MKSKKRQVCTALLFMFFMICLLIITSIIEAKISSENLVLSLVFERTKSYKIKQVLTILIAYLYGKLFLICTQKSVEQKLQNLLAFPIAICIWCITSYVVLLLDIPYNAYVMCFILLCLLVVLLIKCRNKIQGDLVRNIIVSCIYVVGFACLATSGLLYIQLTEDSYYFISQYAEIITNMQSLNPDYCSMLMSWTGISPALINSLPIMMGFETMYGIHHIIMLSFVGIFGYSVYELGITYLDQKKAKFVAIIVSILLVITPAVGITMGLELSSSYFVVYIFLFVFLSEKIQYVENKIDYEIVIILIEIMLVLTRQEASVVLCFFIVGISVLKYENKELVNIFVLPCILTQISYLVKMVLVLNVGRDNGILLNTKSMAMIMGVNILTFLYVLLVRNRILFFAQKHLHAVLIYAMGIVQVGLFIMEPEKIKTNLLSELSNSVNSEWGLSFWMILFLVMYSIFLDGKFSYLETLWIGYLMYYFIICAGRKYDLRVGITDSYARMMVCIIPIAYYAFMKKIFSYRFENYDRTLKN